MTGSVGAYVAQVDRVLVAGQGLFPNAGGPAGVTGSGGPTTVPSVPGRSALDAGVADAGAQYRRQWGTVTGLDAQTNGAAGEGQAEGRRGRAGATAVRDTARSQAAAIAPSTGSPGGVRLLVSTMEDRLTALQREIDTTKAQNRLLGERLRQVALAYRMGSTGASARHGDDERPQRISRWRRNAPGPEWILRCAVVCARSIVGSGGDRRPAACGFTLRGNTGEQRARAAATGQSV